MTSRREFGSAIACGAVNLLVAAPRQKQVDSSNVSTDSEIEARYTNALRVYGDRLSEFQRERLRKILVQNQRRLANVRTFPLKNADSPATTLRLEPQNR